MASGKLVMGGDGHQETLHRATRSAEDEREQRDKYDHKRQRPSSRSRRRRAESKSKMTLSCPLSAVATLPLAEERTTRTLDVIRPQTAPPTTQGQESSRRTTIQRFVRSYGSSPPVTATPIDRNRSDGDRGCNEGYRDTDSKERQDGHGTAGRRSPVESEMENPVANEKQCAKKTAQGQQRGASAKEVDSKVSGGFTGIMGRHFNYLIMASKRVLSGNRTRQKSGATDEPPRHAAEDVKGQSDGTRTNAKLCTQHDEDNNAPQEQTQQQSVSKATTMECRNTETIDSSEELRRTWNRQGESGEGDVVKQALRRGVSGPVGISPNMNAIYPCSAGQRKQAAQAVRSVVNRNVSTPAVRKVITLPRDQYGNQRANGDCGTSACSDNVSDAQSENSSLSSEDEEVNERHEWRSEGDLEPMRQGGFDDEGEMIVRPLDEESEEGCEMRVTLKQRSTKENDVLERGPENCRRQQIVIDEDNSAVLIRLTSYKQMRNTQQQGKSMSSMKMQKSYKFTEKCQSSNLLRLSDKGASMETKTNAESARMRSKHSSAAHVQNLKIPESKILLKSSARNDQHVKMIHASTSNRIDEQVLLRKPDVSTKNAMVSSNIRRVLLPTDRVLSKNMLNEREKVNGGQENEDCRCHDDIYCSSLDESIVGCDDSVEYDQDNPQDYEGSRTLIEDKIEDGSVDENRENRLDHIETQRGGGVNTDPSSETCGICKKIGIETQCGHIEEIEKAPAMKRVRENYPAQCQTREIDPKGDKEKKTFKIIKCPSMSPIISSDDTSYRQCDRSTRHVAPEKATSVSLHHTVSVDYRNTGPTPQSNDATSSDPFEKTKRDSTCSMRGKTKSQTGGNNAGLDAIPSSSSRSIQTSSTETIARRSSVSTTATQYIVPSKCGMNIKTLCSFQMPRSPKVTDLRLLKPFSSGSDDSGKFVTQGDEKAAAGEGSVPKAGSRSVLVTKDIERLVSESFWHKQNASVSTVESSTSAPMTDATVLERESHESKEEKVVSTVQSRASSEGNRVGTSEASAATSHGSIISEDMEYEYDPSTNTILQKATPQPSSCKKTPELPCGNLQIVKCRCRSNDHLVKRLGGNGGCSKGSPGTVTAETEEVDERSGGGQSSLSTSYYTAPLLSSSSEAEQHVCADANTKLKRQSLQGCPIIWEKEVSVTNVEKGRCSDNAPEIVVNRTKTTRDRSCGSKSDRDDDVRAMRGKRDRGCGSDSVFVYDGDTPRRKRRIIRPSRCSKNGSDVMERLMEIAVSPTRKKVTMVYCQTSNHSITDRSKSPQGGRTKWRREEVEKMKVIDESPVTVGKMWMSPIESTKHEKDSRTQKQQVYSTRIDEPPGRNACCGDATGCEGDEEVIAIRPIQILTNDYPHIGCLEESFGEVICPYGCTEPDVMEENPIIPLPPSAGLAEHDESFEELFYEKIATPVDREVSAACSWDSAERYRDLRIEEQSSRLLQTISAEASVVASAQKCPHSSLCTIQMQPRCHCKERYLSELLGSRTTQEEQFLAEQCLDMASSVMQPSTRAQNDRRQRCVRAEEDSGDPGFEDTTNRISCVGEEKPSAPARCCSQPFRFIKLRTCAGLLRSEDVTDGCGCQKGRLCKCCTCKKPGIASQDIDSETIPLICNASGRTVVVGYIRLPLNGYVLYENQLPTNLNRVKVNTERSQASRDQYSQTEGKVVEDVTSRTSDIDVTKSLTPEGMESIRSGEARPRRNLGDTEKTAPPDEEHFYGTVWGELGEGDNVTRFSTSVKDSARVKTAESRARGKSTVRSTDGDSVASYMAASLGESGACSNAAIRRWRCAATSPVAAVRGGGSSCGSTASPSRLDEVTASSGGVGYPACLGNLPRYLVLGEGERIDPNKVKEYNVVNGPSPKKTMSKQNTQKTLKSTPGGTNIPSKKTTCNVSSGIESPGADKDNSKQSCTITKSAAIFNFTECETTFLQNIRCDDLPPTEQVESD